jgi:hypothetical protein
VKKTVAIQPSDKIEEFFATIQEHEVDAYKEHFYRIAPKDPMAMFQRYLFAYASVHTTWKYNVKLYNKLELLQQIPCKVKLEKAVTTSGAGLHNMRINGVWKLREDFWTDHQIYHRKSGESWVKFRNRLVKHMYGLGLAKVSFAIELTWPLESQVVCLDVHMLRNMGLGPSPRPVDYHAAEKIFVGESRKKKIPPAIARLLFWDKHVQEKQSARYWSDCIHPVNEDYSDVVKACNNEAVSV